MPGPGVYLILGAMIVLDQLQRKTNRKTKRDIMAAIDELNDALDGISTELTKVSADTDTLIKELADANQNPAVDLSGVIAKAQAIKDKLAAIDALVPDAPVPAEPAA